MCENGKKNKEEKEMAVTTLRDIERRVKANSSEKKEMIDNFQRRIERRGLKKGRVRPRNMVEQQILDSFKRK